MKNQLGAALQTEAKLASLGLRIRKGCSFHGLALNVNMDMTPSCASIRAAMRAWP